MPRAKASDNNGPLSFDWIDWLLFLGFAAAMCWILF